MPATRKLGSEILLEAFPQARALWSLTASNDKGYVNAFTLTGYSINGCVVVLQEFAEHGWDVYVQASPSGEIAETIKAVARATARTHGDYRNPTV